MDRKNNEPIKSVKLSPEVKAVVPEWITILQKLQKEAESELKQEKEEKPQGNEKKETVTSRRSKETDSENLKLLVSVLRDLSAALHKDESLTPGEKRKRVLQKLQQRISEAFDEAEKELDSINQALSGKIAKSVIKATMLVNSPLLCIYRRRLSS